MSMSTSIGPGDLPAPGKPERGSRVGRIAPLLGSMQGYIALVLIIGIGIWSQGNTFLNVDNLTNAVGAFASRGILAVGMTLVIITAGIDLSVGSLLAVGAMTSALLLVNQDMGPVPIVLISMAVGAVFGFLNGAGTAWLRIQPFVMTLAMMTIARGMVRQVSNNVSVGTTLIDANGQVTARSQQFQVFGTPGHNILTGVNLPLIGTRGVYYPVVAFIGAVIVFQVVLAKTKFGRHVYAVGGNPTAARLSGVNVSRVTIAVFALTGLLAGFAGPITAAYNASADPQVGLGYELDAIAAVVIGGASLAGGTGSVIGTGVGALILTLLDNVLGLNSISDNLQLIAKGLIVIVAVVIQRPGLLADVRSGLRRFIRRAPEPEPDQHPGSPDPGSASPAELSVRRPVAAPAGSTPADAPPTPADHVHPPNL